MPEGNHKQVPIQVWVDVDEGIAHMVLYLNTISGVRTIASCQGTLGEGGPKPYRAQVMATWPPGVFERLRSEFDVTILGDNWGYLHPRNVKADVTLAARPAGHDTQGLAARRDGLNDSDNPHPLTRRRLWQQNKHFLSAVRSAKLCGCKVRVAKRRHAPRPSLSAAMW